MQRVVLLHCRRRCANACNNTALLRLARARPGGPCISLHHTIKAWPEVEFMPQVFCGRLGTIGDYSRAAHFHPSPTPRPTQFAQHGEVRRVGAAELGTEVGEWEAHPTTAGQPT